MDSPGLALGLALVLWGACTAVPLAAAPLRVGDAAPAWGLPDLAGSRVMLPADLQGKVVVLHFWASWCQPCKAMVPALEAVAGQYAGRLRVGKLNVEDNGDVPMRYAIHSLPTLLLFKRGQVAEQRVGLVSKDALAKLVESHLQ